MNPAAKTVPVAPSAPMPPEWKWDSLPVLKEVIEPKSPPPEPAEETP